MGSYERLEVPLSFSVIVGALDRDGICPFAPAFLYIRPKWIHLGGDYILRILAGK